MKSLFGVAACTVLAVALSSCVFQQPGLTAKVVNCEVTKEALFVERTPNWNPPAMWVCNSAECWTRSNLRFSVLVTSSQDVPRLATLNGDPTVVEIPPGDSLHTWSVDGWSEGPNCPSPESYPTATVSLLADS